MGDQKKPSAEELKAKLNREQFHVTQERGTEAPFSGEYYATKDEGTFLCVCCGEALFPSNTKYDSGTGWPSFWAPESDAAVESKLDSSQGMTREEVCCAQCGAHLGHVFADGPQPTGLRYCINSAALDFAAKDDNG